MCFFKDYLALYGKPTFVEDLISSKSPGLTKIEASSLEYPIN